MKNNESKTSDVEIKQQQSDQKQKTRTLTDSEVLSVAGGPEVEVGTGTD